MKPSLKKKTIAGQPSWRLATDEVEAWVTELGGHLGPVTFDCGNRRIEPYSVAPWAEEKLPADLPNILRVLRGDFFCLPFGGNDKPVRGEQHPAHGESANGKWTLEAIEEQEDRHALHLSLETKVRAGRVDKQICLIDGHNAIYSRHTVSGISGSMPLGHHATLRFPGGEGSGHISTSGFDKGLVAASVDPPGAASYSMLKPGATFSSLREVPTITGQLADLSRYPARHGYEDLVMLLTDINVPLAWTAVSFPRERYVWFALKDPRVLRETVMWISNAGRHYPPWNGRHSCVMGLEEVTSFFASGLAESSRANSVSKQGYPTALRLSARHPLVVNYIMAVAVTPPGFDEVATIEAAANGQSVTLTSKGRKKVTAPIDLSWLGL